MEGILLSYLFAVIGVLTPGPNMMAIMDASASSGRGAGIYLALGVASGALLWGVVMILGIGGFLNNTNAWVIIKTIGGMYFTWNGVKYLYAAFYNTGMRIDYGIRVKTIGAYTRGLLVQISNPKAGVTWIGIISLSMKDSQAIWSGVLSVLGVFVISVVANVAYAFSFSSNRFLDFYSTNRSRISLMLGIFFIYFGCAVVTT